MCGGCGIEFSASESDGDEGDWESGDGSIGDILDGEDLSATGSEAAIEDWDGGRMFPGRIIPGRPINGLPGRARRGRRGTPAGMVPRVERPRNRGGRELIDDIAARVPNEPNGHIFAEEDASDFEGSSDGNGHGGSFIDDGELSAGEEGGEDEERGEPMEVDEDIVHAGGDSGDDDDDDDDPPIEELRRRRVARLGPPRARWVVCTLKANPN